MTVVSVGLSVTCVLINAPTGTCITCDLFIVFVLVPVIDDVMEKQTLTLLCEMGHQGQTKVTDMETRVLDEVINTSEHGIRLYV